MPPVLCVFQRKKGCPSGKKRLYCYQIRCRQSGVPDQMERKMRVIAGTARHLPLKTIEGTDTRPTTDRIKETLFNMLQTQLPGCIFLDLFAGSGAIGIEALSRGAKKAYFVEKMPAPLQCIRQNLQFTRLADRAEVLGCDVLSAMEQLERSAGTMDLIFLDPPYGKEWERLVLSRLASSPLAGTETTVIVEARLDTDFSYAQAYGFEMIKQKVYKTNQHVFFRKTNCMEADNESGSISREF